MVAMADLGGLGAEQGPAAVFVWTLPNLLPLLLPWLAVLGLLALPSNRNARAWWIWVPLAALALLGAGLEAAFDAESNDGLGFCVQVAHAASFGLAAIWLLGAVLARRGRALGVVLMALAFAAVSLLALVVSPLREQLWDLRRWEPAILLYLLLFWIGSGLVIAGALNLTGWMSRRRFSGVRVSLRLLFWLWVMWLVLGGLLGCVVTLVSGESVEWVELLMGTVVLSLVSFALILPFLLLSFTGSFYRERLKDLLRLPATDSSPSAPIVSPAAEPGSRQ